MFGVCRWGWNQVLIERNETLAGPLRHVIWFQIRCRGSAKDDLYDGLGIEEVFARWIGVVRSIHIVAVEERGMCVSSKVL